MKTVTLFSLFLLGCLFSFGQSKKVEPPTLAVYRLFADAKPMLKDSLAIYAFNFELNISKKNGNTKVTRITANDTLAFILFPEYNKLFSIDYSSLMNSKSNIRLIIPVLIYGSSPEKKIYKDGEGNPLISFNAAVNAAYSLYNPSKYSNIAESQVDLGNLIYRKAKKRKVADDFWEAVIMNPILIEIHNIK
ncbi:hypothetical protein [Pedobacter sp. ASV28]|uniref:hypothetical protein n=1 Tax=Pedobacter sp. ASV28 TaxID=2795123 RepID=UPI0018ED6CBE|nr:hypothetical protein [Pedobacter sp. ASV28]